MPKGAERTPSAVRHQTEALVRARVLVDQIRLSRLATQTAIERSRDSLSESEGSSSCDEARPLNGAASESSKTDRRVEATA